MERLVMFDGVWDMKIGYVLCGIIWSLACGFSIGNYACSLVHRLPRGRLMLDKTPYCGNCGTLLQTKDLFPVFSALLLRHKCRYCRQPFPLSHTWTELAVGFLFVFAFFAHSYGELFILISIIGVFLITLAAIEVNDDLIMGKILVPLLVAGMVYRTRVDGDIYGFIFGGLMALLAAAFLWRKDIKKVGHIYVMPQAAYMIAVGGLVVGEKHLMDYAILMLVFTAFFFLVSLLRHKKFSLSVPFGWAVVLMVLYPQISVANWLLHLGR